MPFVFKPDVTVVLVVCDLLFILINFLNIPYNESNDTGLVEIEIKFFKALRDLN